MGRLEVPGAVVEGDEAGVDDDAVGVVEAQVALVVDGEVGLDPQAPAQALGDGVDLVDRAVGPAGDPQAGLLLDLAGQALEQRLALVDHPAGRGPVVRAVASAVAHQQEPVRAFEQGPPDRPVAHRPPVWHPGRPRADAPEAHRWRRPAPEAPGDARLAPPAASSSLASMEEPAAGRAVRIVEEAARAAGLPIVVVQHAETTRTAEDAAAAIGCDVAQIVKSLVFSVRTAGSNPASRQTADGAGEAVLALVSGENQLDERRLARAARRERAGQRVEADMVRAVTGFAIGGVPPFGHTTRLRCFVDRDLLRHDVVWAAAGTPHAVFAVAPLDLVRASGGEVAELRRG